MSTEDRNCNFSVGRWLFVRHLKGLRTVFSLLAFFRPFCSCCCQSSVSAFFAFLASFISSRPEDVDAGLLQLLGVNLRTPRRCRRRARRPPLRRGALFSEPPMWIYRRRWGRDATRTFLLEPGESWRSRIMHGAVMRFLRAVRALYAPDPLVPSRCSAPPDDFMALK